MGSGPTTGEDLTTAKTAKDDTATTSVNFSYNPVISGLQIKIFLSNFFLVEPRYVSYTYSCRFPSKLMSFN